MLMLPSLVSAQTFTLDTNTNRIVGFGPRGNVVAKTTVAKFDPSYVWGMWSLLENYSDSGNNVGVYGQANARGKGPTWGMVAEVTDMGEVGATLVGQEITMNMAGLDGNENRMGLDVTVSDARLWRGRGAQTGPVEATVGVRVNATGQFSWRDTFQGWGFRRSGLALTSTSDAAVGLLIDGRMATPIDVQGAIYPALMMLGSGSGAFRVGPTGGLVGHLIIKIDGNDYAIQVHGVR